MNTFIKVRFMVKYNFSCIKNDINIVVHSILSHYSLSVQ